MKVAREHIAHPFQSYRLLRLELPAFDNPRHRHAHLELTWIEQGAGTRFVGSHVAPFGSGDLVLVGPHLPHTWLSAREPAGRACRVTVLQVAPTLLFDSGVPELAALGELALRAAGGLQIAGEANRAVTQALLALDAAPTALQRFAALLGVLGLLWEHSAGFAPLAPAQEGRPVRSEGGRRIDRVLDWIGTHAGEDLSVDAAAALVHVTPAAFSRFFRREVGKGFADYVNDVRCSEACVLLAGSDLGVATVAQTCGFGALSNFNRQFRRRYGMSPGDFRRTRR